MVFAPWKESGRKNRVCHVLRQTPTIQLYHRCFPGVNIGIGQILSFSQLHQKWLGFLCIFPACKCPSAVVIYRHKEKNNCKVDLLWSQSINWANGRYRQQVFVVMGFHLLPITYIFRSCSTMNFTEGIHLFRKPVNS